MSDTVDAARIAWLDAKHDLECCERTIEEGSLARERLGGVEAEEVCARNAFLKAVEIKALSEVEPKGPPTPDQPTEEPQEIEPQIESPDDLVYGEGANEPAYSEQFDTVSGGTVIDATGDTDVLVGLNGKQLQDAAEDGPFATSEQLFEAVGSGSSKRVPVDPDFGPTES